MTTQTRRPTSFVDAGSGGTLAWSNPSNAGQSDDAYATVQTSSAGVVLSRWLYCTVCGFSIPSDALNLSLTCTVERKANLTPFVFCDPYTMLNGAVADALGAAGNFTTSDAVESHNSVLADANLTPALVNQSNFGVAIRLSFHDGDGVTPVIASIDDVVLEISYTPQSGVAVPMKSAASNLYQPGSLQSNLYQSGSRASVLVQ